MKALIALAALIALGATAQTVILYDDGSQYVKKQRKKFM